MERPNNTAIVRINSDVPCQIYRFGMEIGHADAHDYSIIYLPKGRHRLLFVSTLNKDKVEIEKEITDVEYEDIIDVLFTQKSETHNSEFISVSKNQLQEQKKDSNWIEDARKPYKIPPYLKLNYYDDIEIVKYGNINPQKYTIARKNGIYTILNDLFLPTSMSFEKIKECNGNGDCLWVCSNKKWGLYDVKKCRYVLYPIFDDIERTDSYRNCYDLIVTIGEPRKEGKYKLGVVNDNGQLFISCKYDRLHKTSSGCYEARINGKEGLFDKNGKVILDFIYDRIKATGSEGCHPSIYKGKYGMVNCSGKIILDFIYDSIKYYEPCGCGYHELIKDGKYGIHICGNGKIIPCIYNSREEIPSFQFVPYYI